MQGTIEMTLERITQERVHVIGAGRTDAGAHALGQVIAFDTHTRHSPAVLARALNATLPRDITVTSVREVPADFHPRYDASRRLYRYLIWNRPERSPFWEERAAHVSPLLNVDAMREAARALLGRHDFSAFVAAAAPADRVREIYDLDVRREGETVVIDIEGNGFMKQMIRTIAGTLIDVGLGKLPAASVQEIMESRDRRRASTTAPACGLYLVRVTYDSWSEGAAETAASFEEMP